MRKHKISIDKVQEAFNAAIKRRDCRCMVRDYEPCSGPLECSHYFTTGANPALRFYPLNAYAQCQRHHFNHRNKKESAEVYKEWMFENHITDYNKMDKLRFKFIKYTDELKAEIIRLCNADKLDELQKLIEEKLGE